MLTLDTLGTRVEDRVLYATLNSPPLNLIGPEMVRDLVSLVLYLESHDDISVVVFDSASPDFFGAHVDMARASELGGEIARLEPGAPLGVLYRRISTLNQVSIAAITGRVRGAGSEFTLACDIRFASASAIFGQPEVGIGAIPGAGAVQHLTRLMGRGRALEALIGADDFSAELAERYGWINRAVPEDELPEFVSDLARRIARFPVAGIADAKRRVNAIALPGVDALREDSQLFLAGLARPVAKARITVLFEGGLQTQGSLETGFGPALGDLPFITDQ
ncbi:enoyl-CoA hydratase/isomerase family protein [Mycobacterium sp.]|uniref:enoyl-CoA hydratase/isomerase family protein n=1 Tax=Mycobacterium sp. TaxID=1785 RepID=UPI003C714033